MYEAWNVCCKKPKKTKSLEEKKEKVCRKSKKEETSDPLEEIFSMRIPFYLIYG
jgi:hypothetical protein